MLLYRIYKCVLGRVLGDVNLWCEAKCGSDVVYISLLLMSLSSKFNSSWVRDDERLMKNEVHLEELGK